MESLVFNIQKYSIHDGDGIRTTIFFKGCPLACKWCHNPESQSYKAELLYNEENCTGCGTCVQKCDYGAIALAGCHVQTDRSACVLCGECINSCLSNARTTVGKTYIIEELMKEIEKDKMFYEESGGGITLSGGEVMAQDMDYILTLLKKCKRLGYKVNIDTCGHVPLGNFQKIMPYVDTFLYDIKHMNSNAHKNLTGQDNKLVLSNLKALSDAGSQINIRIPLIEGVNSDNQHIDELINFLETINFVQINLLPYHNTGKVKYSRLDMVYEGENFKSPSPERMEEIKDRFAQHNLRVKIGG